MSLSLDDLKERTSGWLSSENGPNWLHRQVISILKCGKVPKHVAIIMDGNRRYAKQRRIDRQLGHMRGFDKLTETLEWCLDLGINEVTVYAFSIENFKRSPDEVDGLMNLFRVKMKQLIDDRRKLEQHGVCVRVLGNIKLLPADLQQLVAEAVAMSSNFTRAFLNVCIAYTSREEMATSMADVADGIASGLLTFSDVDEALLNSCLYTSQCQPVDLLLRTSGEVRLSDFMLWQSSYSILSFVSVLWPEFSRWDLYSAVLFYQHHLPALQTIKEKHLIHKNSSSLSAIPSDTEAKASQQRKERFLNQLTERKLCGVHSLI